MGENYAGAKVNQYVIFPPAPKRYDTLNIEMGRKVRRRQKLASYLILFAD
jgi:hypothetical protein